MTDSLFAPPALAYVATAEIELEAPLDLGETPEGRRRIVPIAGGRVDGPELTGTVVRGGADWQRVLPDGTTLVEARYTLRLDDGELVSLLSKGIRTGPPEVLAALARGEQLDQSQYVFRLSIRARTASPAYRWLNTSLLLATAERRPDAVRYDLYRVT
ncbi:DUF3237 domain-containing protein [Kribbella sp. NPDC056861]|uniref:DUF3237 domain-containing protein n=1 Tax=Kribbella sp. NPDC056861 TaxID=3154857 RepID=UPI0034129BAB